jgi:fatty-acid desaturase
MNPTGKILNGLISKINTYMLKNILQSSTSTLNYIQFSCLLIAVLGFSFVDFTLQNILVSVAFFYVFSIIGLSLVLHRYYSHKSFEFKYTWLRKIFTFIALISGRGSPLGWVYIHRLHHRYADTEKDPHGPISIGFRLFGFKPIDSKEEEKMKVFLVKDMMTKEHLFMHNYYLGFVIVWALALLVLDFSLLYFAYIIPLLGIQFSQNCFNYFAHKYGYRNHNTKDDSTNNILLWPFIWGDAWHNNHHANLGKITTKEKWWEFDPVVAIAGVIKK